jgi:hypothetical protein
MSLIDRIRRFWRPSKLDHPLNEPEREELEQPQSAFDVRAGLEEKYVGSAK